MPPVVHHAIDVEASPEACWRVFADLATWHDWFPFLRGVRFLDGGEPAWRIGQRIEMKFAAGPLAVPVVTTVTELDPARRVRWKGGRMGMRGDHWYEFSVNSTGVTRVTSHEEFTGAGARLVPKRIVDHIDQEVHASMARFKALVERP